MRAAILAAVAWAGMGWAGASVSPAADGSAAPKPVAPKPAAPGPVAKGMVVHEWGVFRVHEDIEIANADMRAIWEGLPKFMYGFTKDRVIPVEWPEVEIRDRPVIFFHSATPMDLRVRVDFPGGMPAVWWPGTESPATTAAALNGAVPGAGSEERATHLQWRLRLNQAPPNAHRALAQLPAVEKGHWVETLRAVNCADVYARIGKRGAAHEREKFVYYDGIFRKLNGLTVKVQGDNVSVSAPAGQTAYNVTVVDRRKAGTVRVGRLEALKPGETAREMALSDADAGTFAGDAGKVLVKQLTQAGLFADEAESLVKLWGDELFGTAGVTVFYRLPQADYDRLLPLTLEPKPEQLSRVALVHQAHCEPDLADRVAAVVKELDADDFAAREAALKKLGDMGRAAFVHLARMRKQTLPAEVRSRVELLLERYESRKALER